MMLRLFLASLFLCLPASAADADLILHNGKVVTVDAGFHIVEAIAVKSGRITATGTSADVLQGERDSADQRWWTSAAKPSSLA